MRAFSQVLGTPGAPGIDLPGLDFVKLADGMGCAGRLVERVGDLADALVRGHKASGPYLIEVVVDSGVARLYGAAG
jgi:benzoylformate decarboxylase